MEIDSFNINSNSVAGVFFAATRPTVYTATVTMMVTNPEETTNYGRSKL